MLFTRFSEVVGDHTLDKLGNDRARQHKNYVRTGYHSYIASYFKKCACTPKFGDNRLLCSDNPKRKRNRGSLLYQ